MTTYIKIIGWLLFGWLGLAGTVALVMHILAGTDLAKGEFSLPFAAVCCLGAMIWGFKEAQIAYQNRHYRPDPDEE